MDAFETRRDKIGRERNESVVLFVVFSYWPRNESIRELCRSSD